MEADRFTSPHLDRLFAVLSDARRRHVLPLTIGRRGGTDVDDLARSIATLECNRERPESSPEAIRSVAVAPHHVHLPELSAAGLLEYDVEAGTVSRRRLPRLAGSLVTAAAATPQEVNAE